MTCLKAFCATTCAVLIFAVAPVAIAQSNTTAEEQTQAPRAEQTGNSDGADRRAKDDACKKRKKIGAKWRMSKDKCKSPK